MKRILLPFVIFFSAVFLCASCLDDADDAEFIFTDDTAVSGFTLGTLNRYLHTTSSDGKDSVYVVSVAGDKYKFSIDQIKREIYNVDSLPVGTDNAHVICNITSKNSGVIVIKDTDSDTLRYYSSSDSIDFTEPREISVFDLAGTGRRTYKVSVNVHREYADSVSWQLMCAEPQFAGLTAMKAVEAGGSIYVFGTDGGATYIFRSAGGDVRQWSGVTPDFNRMIPAGDYSNVAVKDGMIYMLMDGVLMTSADARAWTVVPGAAGLTRLLGAGGRKLYALDGRGGIVSSEDGAVWTAESMDGAADMLPDNSINIAAVPVRTNAQTERVVLVGNHARQVNSTDTAALVWSKVEEYAPGSADHSWIYYDNAEKNLLPRLENLAVTCYDGALLAFGGNELDGGKAEAFAQVYTSKDCGLTWHGDTRFSFPKEFSSSPSSFALVRDKDNFLYVICGATGQVWRARLNRLGWEQHRSSFTE